MKIRKRNWTIFSILIIMIGIATWWFNRHHTYETIIPAESKLVIKIDYHSCRNNPIIQQKIQDIQQKILNGIQGIDWNKPIYIFVTPNEYIGIVGAISDHKALTSSLNALPTDWKPTDKVTDDDATWSTLKNGWQLAWRSNAILLMGPGSQQEAGIIRQTMREIMNEDYNESFLSTPYYKSLNQLKGDINMISRINVLPVPYNTFIKLQLPENISVQQTYLCSEIQVKKDKLHIQNTIYSNDEKDEKTLIHQPSPLLGHFKSYVDTSNRITLYMHTTGKKLLHILREEPDFRAMLGGMNQVIDADQMICSIKGEVLLQIRNWSVDQFPTFVLQAQLDNQDFLHNVSNWQENAKGKKEMSIHSIHNGYEVSYKNYHLFFKAENNQLLMTSGPSIQASPAKMPPCINQSTMYMTINFAKLWNNNSTQKSDTTNLLYEIGQQLNILEFKAKNSKFSTIDLYYRK